jgi:uncharacterized membrane protein
MATEVTMEAGIEQELRRGWRKRRARLNDRGAGERPERAFSKRLADGGEGLARGLGWFSVGLGLAQLSIPEKMSWLSVGQTKRRTRAGMRALGLRELTCGLGILSGRGTGTWLWARVAGDLVDLALLGRSLKARRTKTGAVLRSMGAVLGVAVLDTIAGVRITRSERRGVRAAGVRRFTRSITVNRPAEEVYRFWRNLQNLPRFMAHLESVEVRDDRRSHWRVKSPGGRVEWDAEIVEDRPNELICWRSLEGAEVDNAGAVRFVRAAGGRGTEIHLEMQYDSPGGRLGVFLAKLLGEEPGQQVAGDLRRLKQVIETGEVLSSDASIHRGRHPAQPPRRFERSRTGGWQ